MLRKILVVLTILLIVFLGYFSYKLLKEKEVAINSLLDAVPFDASLIIEINRPEILFNIIYSPPIDAESFLSIPFIKDPLEKLKTIDSVASQDKIVKAALRRPHSAIISGHHVGKDELEMVYYLKLNSEKEFPPIEKLIRKNIQAKGNISQHNYEDARIYDVSISNRKSGGFSYVHYKGMVVLSKSSILIEEVIRQTKSNKSIKTKAGLETVLKTAGKSSPFNLYLNFDYFPTLALNFIHSRFQPELESISKFAHWIELDCNVNKNAIILTGFSSAENTNGFLSDIFHDQEPFNLTLPGLLPSEIKGFFSLGISNYEKFRINFSDYQKKNLSNPDFDINLNKFKKTTGIDLTSAFSKIFEKEVCFSYLPGNGENIENNIFTVIKTKGNSEARQFITECTSAKEGVSDSILNQSIIETSAFNIPKLLFGNIFGLNKNSFCTIIENYIIFCDSVPQLSGFAREFSQQKNLSLDLNYRNLVDLISEDTYCYFYLSPEAEQLYRHYLKYTSEQMFSQYKYGLSQVQAIVYQFGRNNNLFYNNAFIQFSPKPKGTINKLWEIKLDNELQSKISIVDNHLNRKNEIICQDKSNNIYLISNSGEILWKRKLDEKIMGDIYQADLFKNKKLQYVFNTAQKIFALDRNGKDVEGFPIKLTQKASGEMAVFDYDNSRNYRFLVPITDNRLYCFDKTGKEVEGWTKPIIGNKPRKIQYVAVNGKDFIVVPDEKEIHFFDRKGQQRIKTPTSIYMAPNSDLYENYLKNSFYFVCSDSSGTVNLIALNGEVTKVQTGIYPMNHYYLHTDIDFDEVKDHIFFYDKKFEAFTSTGARIINFPLKGHVNRLPKIINLSDSTYLFSYTDTLEDKIYLNNNHGDALTGTPFAGNSELYFRINENTDQKLNLYYSNNNILISISVK